MASNRNILLVEDSESLAAAYQGFLRSENYNIVHCADINGTIEKLKSQEFDLILLDLELPDSSGFDVLKFINSNRLPVSIIVITALGSFDNADIAMQSGVFDFLTKPFGADRLKDAIKNALQLDSWLFGEYELSKEDVKVDDINKARIVDFQTLSKLEQDVGPENSLAMVKIFLNETEGRVARIRRASKERNFKNISREIHVIKSTAGTYGVQKLQQKAILLDLALKRSDEKTIDDELENFIDIAKSSFKELAEYYRIEERDKTEPKEEMVKILLVEDSESLAALYKGYLRNDNYVITHVNNGMDAIDLLNTTDLDIVLLDLGLPDANGVEVLQCIHANQIPVTVIVITALASFENADVAAHYGAFDFLTKPITAQSLKSSIKNAENLDNGYLEKKNRGKKDYNMKSISEPDLLDYDVITKLEEDAGVENTISIIRVFLIETRIRIDAILRAARLGKYNQIGQEVHVLKSTAGTYGLPLLQQKAVVVDMAYKNGQFDLVENEIEHLYEIGQLSLFELENYYEINDVKDVVANG